MNKKPNILMLILDGIRADSLSCYGYSKNTTPNIDRIANKSVVYENAFSAGGWTLPAMASIFTGAYPSKHGVHNENRHLSSKNLTLAQSLHEYGYCSAKFSDVHYMGNSSGMSRGFDFDFDYKRTKLQKIWKRTKNVIFNHNDKGGFERTEDFKKWVKSGLESPFFAYIHYEESHYPHRTPSPYKNHFLPNGINYKQASKLDLGPTEHYAGLSDLKEKEFEIRRSLYDQSLLYVDNLVGDLYSFMEKEGLLEDTIIIITSDHGENFGENGHLAHWYVLYDTIIKVPLIIHNPSIFGTGRISSLVQTLDIYSTFGEILEFDDLFKICNNNHTIGFKIMQNISKIITEHLIKSNHKVLKLTTAFSLLIDN